MKGVQCLCEYESCASVAKYGKLNEAEVRFCAMHRTLGTINKSVYGWEEPFVLYGEFFRFPLPEPTRLKYPSILKRKISPGPPLFDMLPLSMPERQYDSSTNRPADTDILVPISMPFTLANGKFPTKRLSNNENIKFQSQLGQPENESSVKLSRSSIPGNGGYDAECESSTSATGALSSIDGKSGTPRKIFEKLSPTNTFKTSKSLSESVGMMTERLLATPLNDLCGMQKYKKSTEKYSSPDRNIDFSGRHCSQPVNATVFEHQIRKNEPKPNISTSMQMQPTDAHLHTYRPKQTLHEVQNASEQSHAPFQRHDNSSSEFFEAACALAGWPTSLLKKTPIYKDINSNDAPPMHSSATKHCISGIIENEVSDKIIESESQLLMHWKLDMLQRKYYLLLQRYMSKKCRQDEYWLDAIIRRRHKYEKS